MVALHAGCLEVTCIEVIVYENPVDHSDNRLHYLCIVICELWPNTW